MYFYAHKWLRITHTRWPIFFHFVKGYGWRKGQRLPFCPCTHAVSHSFTCITLCVCTYACLHLQTYLDYNHYSVSAVATRTDPRQYLNFFFHIFVKLRWVLFFSTHFFLLLLLLIILIINTTLLTFSQNLNNNKKVLTDNDAQVAMQGCNGQTNGWFVVVVVYDTQKRKNNDGRRRRQCCF